MNQNVVRKPQHLHLRTGDIAIHEQPHLSGDEFTKTLQKNGQMFCIDDDVAVDLMMMMMMMMMQSHCLLTSCTFVQYVVVYMMVR
jgi:hypothetical protein